MKQSKALLRKGENISEPFKRLYALAQQGVVVQALELILRPLTKSISQEMHYHSLIGDFSRTDIPILDDDGNVIDCRKVSPEVWKAKLVWDFEQVMKEAGTPLRHGGYTTLSMDGRNVIQIRPSTTQFTVSEGSQFIEYLYSVGADLEVRWTDSRYLDYREA